MYPICPLDLTHPRRRARLIPWSSLLVLLLAPLGSIAQGQACPTPSAQAATPADAAYRDSDFSTAERLYADAVRENPGNLNAAASLVQTLLHEDKIGEAWERVQAMLAAGPHSSLSLAAEAEVELRRGHPWAASQLLDAAEASDPCNARVPLTRSRILRIDSMYAAERGQIEKAYALDPTDADVANAFHSIHAAAEEIAGTVESLGQMQDLDAATREKAEKSVHDLLPLLSENSQTCKVLPTVPAATLPLLPSMEDGKTIDGFRLEAQLPKTSAKLAVDTAASGLYITRALAEANGLAQGPGDPVGTVRLATLHIGSLEFRNCLVGVSDVPFTGKVEGFIGTDIFSAYLIRIDPRAEKLTLSPLPNLHSIVPGDRPTLPELAGFMPVYHRRQYLLVPVTLNNKSRELFALDTGMRSSTMTPEVAHALSNLKMNFTNTFQTVSGPPIRVYRDSFDLQFANLTLSHQSHVVEFDPTNIDRSAGLEIGGLLGFDILHQIALGLDYRDGLVSFDATSAATPGATDLASASPAPAQANAAPGNLGSELGASDCPRDDEPRSIKTTVEATVQITMDSEHMKPGKQVWVKVVNGYTFPGCTLTRDSMVYGRVVTASSRKNSGSADLEIAFDRGDCKGRGKQQISMRLIGIVAPPPDAGHLHEMLPTEVVGGARRISDTTAETDGYDPAAIVSLVPPVVHPGVVIGMPTVSLQPAGGSGCSARISSSGRKVELGSGVELILAAYGPK